MPGSPPISTSEPLTMPPPSRRSTSALPRDTRSSCVVDTSLSASGFREPPGTVRAAALLPPVTTSFSTMVFHSPQAGHRPIHLLYSLPQWLQNHTDLVFFTLVAILPQRYEKSPQWRRIFFRPNPPVRRQEPLSARPCAGS